MNKVEHLFQLRQNSPRPRFKRKEYVTANDDIYYEITKKDRKKIVKLKNKVNNDE